MKRIYIIEPKGEIDEDSLKLIAASSQSEALRIVTKNLFDCRVATTLEVAKMLDVGGMVEGKMDDEEELTTQETEGV